MGKRFFKKGDIVIYLISAILIIALFCAFVFPEKSPLESIEIVDLSSSNGILASFDVKTSVLTVYSDEVSYEIKDGAYFVTVENGGKNVVKIQNGTAVMVYADCSNNADCTRFPRIERGGEQIICLPHSLLIRGIGEKDHLVIG